MGVQACSPRSRSTLFESTDIWWFPTCSMRRTSIRVRSEYESVLDAAAHELFEIGELNSTYASLPFERRYTTIIT